MVSLGGLPMVFSKALTPLRQELDNETVSEVERRAALPPMAMSQGMVGMGRAVARRDAGSDPAEDLEVS